MCIRDRARNVKPSFSWGLILGIIFTGIDQILFRGRMPFTLKHKHADHETLKPANEMPKIEYPKPDNIITFDKTSSVYLTGTNHADNQPVHLKLKDPSLPIDYTLEKFDEPAQRYCPAGVYEVQHENGLNKFVINSQNCIHCKTCDIKEPSQNITGLLLKEEVAQNTETCSYLLKRFNTITIKPTIPIQIIRFLKKIFLLLLA